MGIYDKRLMFTASQALSGTGAALSDIIDLSEAREIGVSGIYWVVQALTASVNTGTYTFALQTDDNSGFSTPNTLLTFSPSPTIPAGAVFSIMLPEIAAYPFERYLRVLASLGGTSPAVTVQSYLTNQPPTAWKAYPAPYQA